MSRWRSAKPKTCAKCNLRWPAEDFCDCCDQHPLCHACCPYPLPPGGAAILEINAILGRIREE